MKEVPVVSSSLSAGSLRTPIKALEFHVAFGCNLACVSCSHYSNHAHKGRPSVLEMVEQLDLWGDKISPSKFCLLGGEPALNPDLVTIVRSARQVWSHKNVDCEIELVSNGFLLHRFPELPRVLSETNATLIISEHHNSNEYQQRLEPVRRLLDTWECEYGIKIIWRPSFDRWTKRYHGYGEKMMPFSDGDQRQSWRSCSSKFCTQLYAGCLWKCPAIAYLGLQKKKYGLPKDWDRYLNYEPLRHDASPQEVRAFFEVEDEEICLMCPANPKGFTKPNPFTRPH